MTKIKAFFAALVLVFCIALSLHFYADAKSEADSPSYYSWTSEVKYKDSNSMKSRLDEDTIPVLGSSELQHQKKTPYHPSNVFAGQQTKLMLIGAGYYQSLFHATLVAALDDSMENRKVVLIVAPQWFRKSGVKPEAYASRFSEQNYIAMLENPRLSEETKAYIVKRTHKLLKVDPKGLERVKKFEKYFTAGKGNAEDIDLATDWYLKFMQEKEKTNVALRLTAYEILDKPDEKQEESFLTAEGDIDFDALRAAAAKDGEEACGGNQFFVKKSYYNNYIMKVMDEVKDEGIRTGYSVSLEFDDFECFLKVCTELGVEPLIVISPVNGYWYDWIGFPADAREEYYSQVRDLTEKCGAKMADFSDREYEEYFMEDTVHVGWKGWVDVCEEIYRFASE